MYGRLQFVYGTYSTMFDSYSFFFNLKYNEMSKKFNDTYMGMGTERTWVDGEESGVDWGEVRERGQPLAERR